VTCMAMAICKVRALRQLRRAGALSLSLSLSTYALPVTLLPICLPPIQVIIVTSIVHLARNIQLSTDVFHFAPYSPPVVDLRTRDKRYLHVPSVRCACCSCVICFSRVLFAVGCGARLLPELETGHQSSHRSLVPIDPHVIHHYYRWLS